MSFEGHQMQLAAPAQELPAQAPSAETYRLVVFDPAGTAVMLESVGKEYRLPRIQIPQFARPAQEVTKLLRGTWGVPAVFLFSGLLEQSPEPSYFAALESEKGIGWHPPNTNWFTIHHALSNLILPRHERRTLDFSYRKAVHGICAEEREFFCRIGWMQKLEEWIETVVQPLGMKLESHDQFNGCETFSLICFTTNTNPVWFK